MITVLTLPASVTADWLETRLESMERETRRPSPFATARILVSLLDAA